MPKTFSQYMAERTQVIDPSGLADTDLMLFMRDSDDSMRSVNRKVFYDYMIDSQQGRPAQYFGIYPEDFNQAPNTYTDQLNLIQDAMDWSEETRKPVFFGGGVFGHDGTIIARSNSKFLGAGYMSTFFQQKDTTNYPDCFLCEDFGPVSGGGVTAGAGAMHMEGFCINGGWDKKSAYGVGTNWDYNLAGMSGGGNQRGLAISAPNDGAQDNNADGQLDPHSQFRSLRIDSIAGIGLYTDGRGEHMAHNLWIGNCADYGVDWRSFDCWVHAVTLAVTGIGGWKQRGSQMRMSDMKMWFIGYCKQQAAEAAFNIDGAATRNIVGTNITCQDTWGPAYRVQGTGNKISGEVDTIGSLFQEFGFGLDPQPRTYIVDLIGVYNEMDIVVCDRLSMATKPKLIDISGAANGNKIRFSLDAYNSNEVIYRTDPIDISAGNVSGGYLNEVTLSTGKILAPTLTAANFQDDAHQVNQWNFKSLGTERFDSTTGKMLYAAGETTTAVWKDASGATIYTPV